MDGAGRHALAAVVGQHRAGLFQHLAEGGVPQPRLAGGGQVTHAAALGAAGLRRQVDDEVVRTAADVAGLQAAHVGGAVPADRGVQAAAVLGEPGLGEQRELHADLRWGAAAIVARRDAECKRLARGRSGGYLIRHEGRSRPRRRDPAPPAGGRAAAPCPVTRRRRAGAARRRAATALVPPAAAPRPRPGPRRYGAIDRRGGGPPLPAAVRRRVRRRRRDLRRRPLPRRGHLAAYRQPRRARPRPRRRRRRRGGSAGGHHRRATAAAGAGARRAADGLRPDRPRVDVPARVGGRAEGAGAVAPRHAGLAAQGPRRPPPVAPASADGRRGAARGAGRRVRRHGRQRRRRAGAVLRAVVGDEAVVGAVARFRQVGARARRAGGPGGGRRRGPPTAGPGPGGVAVSGELAKGFLDDIVANIDDDTPRLVYADWLTEHGQDDRAEFIRVQVQRARLPAWDAAQVRLWLRERQLLERHGEGWLAEMPAVQGAKWEGFRRGLVAEVSFASFEAMRATAHACRAVAPVEAVTVHWPRRREGRKVVKPIAELRELTLTGRPFEDEIPLLAESPQLATLRALTVLGLDAGDLTRLAASPHLTGLRTLRLTSSGLGTSGVRALTQAATLNGLEELDLSGPGFYEGYYDDPIIN